MSSREDELWISIEILDDYLGVGLEYLFTQITPLIKIFGIRIKLVFMYI